MFERAVAARGDLIEAESHFNLAFMVSRDCVRGCSGAAGARTAGRVLQRCVLGPQGTSQSTDDMIDAACTPFKKW